MKLDIHRTSGPICRKPCAEATPKDGACPQDPETCDHCPPLRGYYSCMDPQWEIEVHTVQDLLDICHSAGVTAIILHQDRGSVELYDSRRE